MDKFNIGDRFNNEDGDHLVIIDSFQEWIKNDRVDVIEVIYVIAHEDQRDACEEMTAEEIAEDLTPMKIPAGACQRCGGWTTFGGMSQHAHGPKGCVCHGPH
jgi:hypothetical protein